MDDPKQRKNQRDEIFVRIKKKPSVLRQIIIQEFQLQLIILSQQAPSKPIPNLPKAARDTRMSHAPGMDSPSKVKRLQEMSQDFKIQVLVKGGLDLKQRTDPQGIFKSRGGGGGGSGNTTQLKKGGLSQDYTAEDTNQQSLHAKKASQALPQLEQLRISQDSENDLKRDIFQGKSGAAGRILQMYTLLDEAMQLKKLGMKKSKRVQAADKLKLMIQELVAENIDLKSANFASAPKKLLLTTGGQIIDNFESAGDGRTIGLSPASPKSTNQQIDSNQLQARIWSLESENALLTKKLKQTIESKEKKTSQLNSVQQQIQLLVQDLQPSSSAMDKTMRGKQGQQFSMLMGKRIIAVKQIINFLQKMLPLVQNLSKQSSKKPIFEPLLILNYHTNGWYNWQANAKP